MQTQLMNNIKAFWPKCNMRGRTENIQFSDLAVVTKGEKKNETEQTMVKNENSKES